MMALPAPRRAWFFRAGWLLTLGVALAGCGDSAQEKIDDQKVTDAKLIEQYIATNGRTGYQKTSSGLYYRFERTNPGGAQPTDGKLVTSQYQMYALKSDATLSDIVQSSYTSGAPFRFRVGNTIAGFTEGIKLMHAGEKAELVIPSGLAYGPSGLSNSSGSAIIAGNTVLVYFVEVDQVQ